MPADRIAAAHQKRRKALAKRSSDEIARLWARIDRADIARSWAASVPAAVTVLASAQAIAAASSSTYLADLADAYDVPDDPAGRVRVDGFAGVASDGRDLSALLFQPAITALKVLKRGNVSALDASARAELLRRAIASGRFELDMITRTQVADAGRTADQVALVAHTRMAGYVRVLSPPSCSRCAIMAGKFYRWNTGFQRHPRCDCTHQPVMSASAANDQLTRPRAYFDSLTEAEQNRVFTNAGAEAIRLGADPSQVVNARRGMQTAAVFGRDVQITTEGTTTRGLAGHRLGARDTGIHRAGDRYRTTRAPRLMPEQILRDAHGDRDEAVRLLRRFGYII